MAKKALVCSEAYKGISFSGTRDGITRFQRKSLAGILPYLLDKYGHQLRHGDCIGADAAMHDICRVEFPSCPIVIHPPTIASSRSFKKGDVIKQEFPYLVRNSHMVTVTECLLAAPNSPKEEIRSGTWYTIRYARSMNRSIFIVHPDGSVWWEKPPKVTAKDKYEVDLDELS